MHAMNDYRQAAAGVGRDTQQGPVPRRTGRRFYWLLALPFIGLLIPPIYAFDQPTVIGIPFFYWYQIVWLAVTALITTVVYRANRQMQGGP